MAQEGYMAEREDEELSSAALRSTKKPWENVRITFTGVEDKVSYQRSVDLFSRI